ncbi:MAG: hypothetical protein R3F20_05155 [Planctomycetota bacterium]
MRAIDLVADLERRLGIEVDPSVPGEMRRPRDYVDYVVSLDPRGRALDPDAVTRELAAALGVPDAPPDQLLAPLMSITDGREGWARRRAVLGADRWPPLGTQPVLRAQHFAGMAVIPVLIFVVALFVTGSGVVAALSAALVTAWVTAFALNRIKETRWHFEPPGLDLATLGRRLAERRAELLALPPETFDRAAVEETVREIARARGGDLDQPF